LAAARQGDQVNPERASSGAQFYFVQGRLFTDQELNGIEKSNERKLEAKLFQEMLNNKQDEVKNTGWNAIRQNWTNCVIPF